MAVLEEVKDRLSIEGTESDKVLKGYIDDVISFCVGAGIPSGMAEHEYGLIARGVSDLWDGKEKFSEIFRMRLMQVQTKAAFLKNGGKDD